MSALPLPRNGFKAGLVEGRSQIGLWSAIPDAFVTEALAGSGVDWMLLDTEHSPGDVLTVLPQLQALLIPYVQSADEARAAVEAMRHPPRGIRGVSALTRATRFGRVADYARDVESELCLLVQVETREALDRLEEIAAVEGVDGVFVGQADLAASLGFVGQAGHPEVVAAVEGAIARIRAAGKPAGILTPDKAFARRCIELGTSFTAVGVDIGVLARQTEALARQFRS